jgi:hypothetical protein
MRAGNSAAKDDDLGRRHAGHSTQENAEAAIGFLQAICADLDGHPAGHLAHRRQQGQRTVGGRHGFVGDGRRIRRHQCLSLLTICSQVQIREQNLALAELRHSAS